MENEIDFKTFLQNFLKVQIFPEQEALILTAMIDNKINKNTAIQLYQSVRQHNMKKYKEIMEMDMDQILELAQR